MLLGKDEGQNIIVQVLAQSRADEVTVTLEASSIAHLRYALNTPSTSGQHTDHVLSVKSTFGKRSATATVTVTASAVFLGASGGHVLVLNADGSTARTLDTTLGGTITGMAFDGQNTLYVTDFTAGNITRFSTSGALTGNFGSGFDCQPESATFDKSGNLYVGLAGCKKNVLKFSSSGNLVDSYSVAIEDQGADWVDLSAPGVIVSDNPPSKGVVGGTARFIVSFKDAANKSAIGVGDVPVEVAPLSAAVVEESDEVGFVPVTFNVAGTLTLTALGDDALTVDVVADADVVDLELKGPDTVHTLIVGTDLAAILRGVTAANEKVVGIAPLAAPFSLPWWLLAIGFYLHGGWRKARMQMPPPRAELEEEAQADTEPGGRINPSA